MYFLFDIGGTKARFGVSVGGEKIDGIKIVETPQSYSEGLTIIKHTFEELTMGRKVGRCVGGIASSLKTGFGILQKSPNLKLWTGRNFADDLEETLGTNILLENDAAIAALGEANFGCGRDYKNIAYITIGTGIGGSRIINGKIDGGVFNFEPGHQLLAVNGKRFEFEDLVSGTAIEKRYNLKPENIVDTNIWNEVLDFITDGLYNVIAFWSPEVVILGGGVSVNEHINCNEIRNRLTVKLTIYTEVPQVRKSKLGDLSGLWGALELAKSSN